jgi:hypothetical protein
MHALTQAIDRDIGESELANTAAADSSKIFARDGVFMGTQMGMNPKSSKLSEVQF